MRIAVLMLMCTWFFESQGIKHSDDYDCMPVNNFVKQYTSLLKAIPLHIVPVSTFCSNELIVQYYRNAVEFFHNATLDENCREMNFQRNRLNVIQIIYDQMTNIWSSAHCQDCVDNSNQTDEFFRLSNNLDSCIILNILRPCEPCANNCTMVQNYYEALDKTRKGSICFDIEDRMNQTRHAWSAKYNCCKDKQHSQKVFISVASVICSLPVVFYALMYCMTRRKEARELAISGPLLDDMATPADESQPGSSGALEQADEIQHDEPKINNLNQAASKLIDLASIDGDSTMNLNLDHGLCQTYKEIKIAAEDETNDHDDDISILEANKAHGIGTGLLD